MLNPITYTEHVVGDFLRYQLTTYPFADAQLHAQMRQLLNLAETRNTPLLKGPYVSLSRSFRSGARVTDLVSEGVLHPHMANLAPYPRVYGHQETAIRAITSGRTTLVSTGTGSGKTEAFLYPIISRCLTLRDEGAPEGIVAVIVYPMNALAEDQLGRLRGLLAGSGISFGMYVGKTPDRTADVPGQRLAAGSSRSDYQKALARAGAGHTVYPGEERIARDQMRTKGKQPRILLTNVKQLELLLTRHKDAELFDNARLEFIVFDEAHTFSGAAGAEAATLIRRLRAYCNRTPAETVCVATSATIADPERGPDAAREFATRFFGVPEDLVSLVGEEYEPDVWLSARMLTPAPVGDPSTLLNRTLAAVSAAEGDAVPTEWQLAELRAVVRDLTGIEPVGTDWQAALFDAIAQSEVAYQANELLTTPCALDALAARLTEVVGRPTTEQELLSLLALGAAARREGRPLLRPVVHAFVRGVAGAVVTFPAGTIAPRLWLSAEDAERENADHKRLPLLSCTTCGQHYFEHHVEDFVFTDRLPGGGTAVESGVVWRPLDPAQGGQRVMLVDHSITDDDGDDDDNQNGSAAADPRWGARLFCCRACGALHPESVSSCGACGRRDHLVPLVAVRQSAQRPGKLTTCVACKASGRQRVGVYREPARPVRAVTVSDVHVLAQNMLQYAERRRLLVFADNRQEAAFQAGWMRDHARRYRLRALMFERLQEGSVSVGDLTAYLDERLDKDDDLSRALVPEVWRVHRKEAEGVKHAEERKRLLRIQVLRELTTSTRQRIGLEPWGRLVVQYAGLQADLPFVAKWAPILQTSSTELTNGMATLLDVVRRKTLLLDREGKIFSRFWHDGDYEIQRGYLPMMPGVPQGLKLRRDPDDDENRVQQWAGRSQTLATQLAQKYGVPAPRMDEFFDELWQLLTDDLKALAPVTLTGSKGRALPRCSGVYQVDADRLRLIASSGGYQCDTCRRTTNRPTPHTVCPAWRCSGSLLPIQEDPDNYDLKVLDEQFAMLRPREHSAQIPAEEREAVERAFKSDYEQVNTLVCTPTLELGVDIGALDSVLMRNVPPLPANYWQRAGRAGRRHRMAVNVTYARTASHDRSYFADPMKLLSGQITPPRFNLRNEIMVRKHVHASVLTALFRLTRADSGLSENDRGEVKDALSHCLPTQVKDYLFNATGEVRLIPFDVTPLATVIAKHESAIHAHLKDVFAQHWPAGDAEVASEERLARLLLCVAEELSKVIGHLARRLNWAMEQMRRLEDARGRRGTLDPDEDALMSRCDRLIKKLKGIETRRRRDAEGFDDTNTYAVLAAEGFLPGYGLDTGGVIGLHLAPRFGSDLRDWEVRRPSSIALREFVPGNLIYANGHRFFPRFFQLEASDPIALQVDVGNEALVEVGAAQPGATAGLGAAPLAAVPICDVDLPHQAHISDDEDHRFQLAVSVFGQEQQRHGAGTMYRWGERDVLVRSSVHLRMVNVGAAQLVRGTGTLGYPLCTVCGQSRSPLASQADLTQFSTDHRERCGRAVANVGFYADVVADALKLPNCASREEAYSVAESLRKGATEILEMELEDLQLLTLGRTGREQVDVVLYDPMPGGSGLLEQMVSRWPEVVSAAISDLENCPSACERACIDCLYTFRNGFYHDKLSRHTALKRLREWGSSLRHTHDVPPALADVGGDGVPVNDAEDTLSALLIRAGFPTPQAQQQVALGQPLGSTTPDFFYEDPTGRLDGICVYLDGMSRHIHGNAATHRRDREIREELRNRGYEVFEIPFGHLSDREAMTRHFYRLGRIMLGRDQADGLRRDTDWFR